MKPEQCEAEASGPGGTVPGPVVGTTCMSGHRFSLTKLTVITVNMHEAKSRLSELVTAVEEGNETIAKYPGIRTLW